MIYSAAQVADVIGPDNPTCNCPACNAIREVKALICETVTAVDTAYLEKRDANPEQPKMPPVWLLVVSIAAARATAQGFPPVALEMAIEHGVEATMERNPTLHHTGNPKGLPI